MFGSIFYLINRLIFCIYHCFNLLFLKKLSSKRKDLFLENIYGLLVPFLNLQPSQPTITCSKLTVETPEQGGKYVQSVSIVNFEQVNTDWQMTKYCHISVNSQFTVILSGIICFSVRFCDNLLFFRKQKGTRVFQWQEDINVVVITAFSPTLPYLSFLKF